MHQQITTGKITQEEISPFLEQISLGLAYLAAIFWFLMPNEIRFEISLTMSSVPEMNNPQTLIKVCFVWKYLVQAS
jgi:hypothetical protein